MNATVLLSITIALNKKSLYTLCSLIRLLLLQTLLSLIRFLPFHILLSQAFPTTVASTKKPVHIVASNAILASTAHFKCARPNLSVLLQLLGSSTLTLGEILPILIILSFREQGLILKVHHLLTQKVSSTVYPASKQISMASTILNRSEIMQGRYHHRPCHIIGCVTTTTHPRSSGDQDYTSRPCNT